MDNLKLKIKNFMSYRKHGKLNRGFTLVETLVAISILSISILGTFTAVQRGLATSTFAKDQVTAFYLIQEAIEGVRNIRDTNGLESIYSQSIGGAEVYWLQGLYGPGGACDNGKICSIDTSVYPTTVSYCGTNEASCPVISQNSSTGLYGYTNGWTPTKFKRSVSLQQVSADETIIVVTVSWTGTFSKSITVKQELFNMH